MAGNAPRVRPSHLTVDAAFEGLYEGGDFEGRSPWIGTQRSSLCINMRQTQKQHPAPYKLRLDSFSPDKSQENIYLRVHLGDTGLK